MNEEKEFSAEEESTPIIDEPSLEDELIPTESVIDSMIDTSIADIEDEKDIQEPDVVTATTPTRSEEHTLNSSHITISYAVFCLKKKKKTSNKNKKKKQQITQ